MAALAARCDVHPNLIANWKKAHEQMLASFSEKKERQEVFRDKLNSVRP